MYAMKNLIYRLYIYIHYILCIYKTENMSLLEAKTIVNNFYPQRVPKFQQKVNYNPKYDLMIIVPVYNTETFLNECIQSIINQKTKYSYKVIFIDDGSTDQSSNILEDYRENRKVKIIHQQNIGIAGARNEALKNICAKYILFVDSDDLLADNAIEVLMDAAYEKNADIVEGEHIEFGDVKPTKSKSKKIHISGYPWGKVILSEKLLNLCFPESYQYEDTIISTLLIPNCKEVHIIPNIVYYYRNNVNSVTAKLCNKKESIDTLYMTFYCFKESLKRGNRVSLEDFLCQVRLNWLRTQMLPINIQKAIFIIEIEMLFCFFDEEAILLEKSLQQLEKVLKKRSFYAYQLLMNNWQIWNT